VNKALGTEDAPNPNGLSYDAYPTDLTDGGNCNSAAFAVADEAIRLRGGMKPQESPRGANLPGREQARRIRPYIGAFK
jgi:hypothetical protein